ncbi:DUF72 domain-containing protein [Taibaiella soli]|uniref:DUF72 domain-containing protein n=1 Tax=Taibaiella soli TaxID=1649169 RepID=A0A2W2AP95_9BACT|nr:DUF72 domain-containing protein [Taibaiella soli]PZF74200.1 DUF72 domain-containing protein [Taibaiella soli]
MDFGKVPERELEQIDFTLPPDPAVTTETLKKGKGKTKFHVGCAKWGRKDWIGKLYPKGTKEKDFLEYYAHLFNSIEFNGFFYSQHSREQVEKWKEKVPKGFKFCPKFTQSITHFKRLKDTRAEVDSFLNIVDAFGDTLGPLFLMPHPSMNLKTLPDIEAFIEDFPKDVALFLELRNEEFYTDGYNPELYAFLRKHKRGTIITDAAGRRDCVHMHLSTPECFIRFVGNSLHHTDYERIDEWVDRLGKWMKEGLQQCYFFMHQHEELHSPELIKYFVEQMNKKNHTELKAPILQENTLF